MGQFTPHSCGEYRGLTRRTCCYGRFPPTIPVWRTRTYETVCRLNSGCWMPPHGGRTPRVGLNDALPHEDGRACPTVDHLTVPDAPFDTFQAPAPRYLFPSGGDW